MNEIFNNTRDLVHSLENLNGRQSLNPDTIGILDTAISHRKKSPTDPITVNDLRGIISDLGETLRHLKSEDRQSIPCSQAFEVTAQLFRKRTRTHHNTRTTSGKILKLDSL